MVLQRLVLHGLALYGAVRDFWSAISFCFLGGLCEAPDHCLSMSTGLLELLPENNNPWRENNESIRQSATRSLPVAGCGPGPVGRSLLGFAGRRSHAAGCGSVR